jgi:hypothetical protein
MTDNAVDCALSIRDIRKDDIIIAYVPRETFTWYLTIRLLGSWAPLALAKATYANHESFFECQGAEIHS